MLKNIARPALYLLLAAVLAGVGGCAGVRVAGMGGALEAGRIVDVKTGMDLTEDELIDRLADVRVTYIGEYHEHRRQHENQLKIIRGLRERHPGLTVGLEIFPRPSQEMLDRWTSGVMDEKEFVAAVIGRELNMGAFEVYWPLLKWARDNRVRLLALNAPRSVTAKVARDGITSLSEEDRRLIADEIVLGPAAYKLRVQQAFKGHEAMVNLDRFFAAQVVWDETMAETAADFLKSPEGEGPLVVICGNEHVYMGHGVPDRVTRRIDASRAIVYAPVASEDLVIRPGDADYVWVTAMEKPRVRKRLGVRIGEPEPGRIVVEAVEPGSEAERIGLRPGDVLTALDGRPVSSLMDLHRAATGEGADEEHTIEVERDGMRVRYHFRFRETGHPEEE